MKGNHHLSGSKSRNSFLLHQGIFKKIVIYDIDLNILNDGIPLKCVNISKKLEAEVEKNSNQMEYPVTIRIMLR